MDLGCWFCSGSVDSRILLELGLGSGVWDLDLSRGVCVLLLVSGWFQVRFRFQLGSGLDLIWDCGVLGVVLVCVVCVCVWV